MKNVKKQFAEVFLLFVILSVPLGLYGRVTIDECQEMARKHYPRIKQFGLIEKSTEYSVSNARKNNLPQGKLFSQATYQNKVTTFPDQMTALYEQAGLKFDGLKKDQYKVGAEVDQNLWDGGLSRSMRQSAETEGKIETQKTEVALYAIRQRVSDLYFGILLLEKRAEQNNNLQKLLESNCNMLRSCMENGMARQSDYDAVKAELLSARNRRIEIETSAGAYRRMLSLFAGKDLNGEVLEVPETDVLHFDTVFLHSDASLRPEMKWFDARKNHLSSQRSALLASLRPKFGAYFQGFYGNPGLDMFEDMLNNGWSWNYTAGVRLQWNFGGYYTKRNKLKQLGLAAKGIDTEKETFLFNSRIRGAGELEEIGKMKKMLMHDEEIVELRSSIRTASESEFKNGVVNVNDLLKCITDENQAKLTEVLHEISLVKAVYDHKITLNE